jgi:Ca-activated chloride channel family protein
MSYGFRPANVNVPMGDPISPQYGVRPEGPGNILAVPSAEVIVAAKDSWEQNRKRADIILVVDVSGSMEGEKLASVKAGLESFLLRILPEDRVGLVIFSDTATEIVAPAPLSENMVTLQTAIRDMKADGQTAVFDGVEVARQSIEALPESEDRRMKAIVLLSDGADNESTITLSQLQGNFGENDISIFSVAYGEDADTERLQEIAEFSRTEVIVGGVQDIAQIFENLSRYF